VNGALHELDVSTTVQNDCFGCKGRQSRSKGAGSTTGAEGHTYMEHLRSGGRVQRHHLGGFDGVTYSPARASFSTQARADASFDITLTAGAIGCVRHPFTPPPPTTTGCIPQTVAMLTSCSSCWRVQAPPQKLIFCSGGCNVRGVALTVNIIVHYPAHGG